MLLLWFFDLAGHSPPIKAKGIHFRGAAPIEWGSVISKLYGGDDYSWYPWPYSL